MKYPEERLTNIREDRIVLKDWDQLSGCLPVAWVVLLIFFGFLILAGIPHIRSLGYAGGQKFFWSIAIFLALLAAPLLYTGGFAINRVTKEVRRLGLPLFTPKPFSFEGAKGIGIRHEMRRVAIKGHLDEVHEYSLFFPMWNDTEHQLYTTMEKERALQLQKELAEHLQLEALPLEGTAPQP